MAEKKYDLLLGPRRDSNLKITHQPWYKERINTKYEKKPLIGSSWTFIKEGIDDFRDGRPPVIDSSVIIKSGNRVKPSIFGSSPFDDANPKQRLPKQLSKKDIVYAKSLPRQERRRQRVTDVEKQLLEHPLALYSHLEESLPPDLFEEIVDLLDPSLTLNDAEFKSESNDNGSVLDNSSEKDDDTTEKFDSDKDDDSNEDGGDLNYEKAIFNARKNQKLFKINEDEVNKEEKSKIPKRKTSPHQLTKIETVTKEFCDWIRDLGGDRNNIEESTVHSLFASGYETKPTLSVPVHVVELANVPPELRADDYATQHNVPIKRKNQDDGYTPSWVKVKYGSWYLDPKSWKTRPADEPLEDPKDIEDKQMSETKLKSKELDTVLSTLHGAKAFRNFIEKRGTRTPEFLEMVLPNSEESTDESDEIAAIELKK